MAIETVLLAVGDQDSDRLDRLASTALELAEPIDATVIVAHVFPEETDHMPETAIPIAGGHSPYVLSNAEYDDVLENTSFADAASVDEATTHHELVRTIVDRFEGADVDHEVRGAVGDPGEALLTLADDVDADRVLVGGRSRSPTDKLVFGSVAQEVLLSSPCPVTFVRDTA